MKTDRTIAIESEQSVIGALLLNNDAIDRIGELQTQHFYREDHRIIFQEIIRQIMAGQTADVISVFETLRSKVIDCLTYLNQIAQSTPSSANIKRYCDIVVDRAIKRALISLGSEIQEIAVSSPDDSSVQLDIAATKIDALSQKKVRCAPIRMSESLVDYTDLLTARMEGRIRPVSTGFADLDRRLDGGFERGTLTVVAARPGMGKTAFGLALCRNTAKDGRAGFLSMEMPLQMVNDRNIAALGHLPISWLRNPTDTEEDQANWQKLTHACTLANELEFYIDDETSLNMLDIRNKVRQIKRKNGLDLLVIDQLSFITGGSKEKKNYEVIGEYTRGLIALAKQTDIAVVLLCQLNRECESRPDRRPRLSDLAMSGSIEQDAANVLFLYRDEVYNPDSSDKGMCEVISAKQRQGQTGVVPLVYIANQTRFEDYSRPWSQPKIKAASKSTGFNDD